jgi:hypothetical protein
MQKANVSHGKTKMDKVGNGESYPAFVKVGHRIEGASFVVRCQCRRKEKKK